MVENELLLVYNHGASKAALGGIAISVNVVKGQDCLVAVLRDVVFAWVAVSTASNDVSHSHHVSCFELAHV